MYSNYIEETKPLFKLLRVQAFRFILVRFNHYALAEQLKKDIRQHCPGRPISEADAATMSYRQLTDAYYALDKGIFIIHNFEQVLTNPELYTGLNLRRDKLAQYPIAMICLISPAADKLYARQLMEKMPDLWSFRSLVLTLEEEIPVAENVLRYTELESPLRTTTLGGVGREEKQQELARLLQLVAQTAPEDKALLAARYEQVKDIQTDLGLYEEAIATIDKLLLVAEDNEDYYARLLIDKGDVLQTMGLGKKALTLFKQAEKTLKDTPGNISEESFAIASERIGSICLEFGDLNKALQYFEQCRNIALRLVEANPKNPNFTQNLAISYQKIGSVYEKLKQSSEALKYFEYYLTLSQQLNSEFPNDVSIKYNLAISYLKQGSLYQAMGNLDQALKYFEEHQKLALKLYNDYANNVSFKHSLIVSDSNLGFVFFMQKNYQEALKHFLKAKKLSEQLVEQTNGMNADFIYWTSLNCYSIGLTYISVILAQDGDDDEAYNLDAARQSFTEGLIGLQKLEEKGIATVGDYSQLKNNILEELNSIQPNDATPPSNTLTATPSPP